MPDIEAIIRRLNIQDPGEAAMARAAATRIATLDALDRERAIASGILDRSPAIRAAAILGLEMQEEAAAATPPPPPVEMDPEVKAMFDKIDQHFNPQPKKESAT